VTFKTTGSQTLTATDTTTSSITGTSGPIAVAAGAADHLVVNTPSTATAGTGFLVTVIAQDAFNNTATGYSGTVHFTSSDGQASLPADGTLSTAPAFSSPCSRPPPAKRLPPRYGLQLDHRHQRPVTVGAAAANHLAFGVQPVGTLKRPGHYARRHRACPGRLQQPGHRRQHRPGFPGIASGPGSFAAGSTTTVTASGGIVTFSNLKLNTPGTYTLSESSSGFLTGAASASFAIQPLLVTAVTPTSTGFTVTFNEPIDPSTLNLYDAATAGFGPADVTLVGATTGAVKGSLVLNASNTGFTFVKTGYIAQGDPFHNNVLNALLKNDTYTVTLRSASNGFKDLNGVLLNGSGNYTTTFSFSTRPWC